MNTWTRLGISAAFSVGFYFLVTEFLQKVAIFEAHKWHVALGLQGAGLLLWATAFIVQDKTPRKTEGSEGHTARYRSGEVWGDSEGSSLNFLTAGYCGIMLMVFGAIVIGAMPATRTKVVTVVRSLTVAKAGSGRGAGTSPEKATSSPGSLVKNQVYTKRSTTPLKLQGIIYKQSNPSAIINGKTVFVGDSISGAKVTAITATSVTLDFDGSEHMLALRN